MKNSSDNAGLIKGGCCYSFVREIWEMSIGEAFAMDIASQNRGMAGVGTREGLESGLRRDIEDLLSKNT